MGHGDGGESEGGGTEVDVAEPAADLDDASFSTPSCPGCLRSMTPASTATGGVYWACMHCGQTLLA